VCINALLARTLALRRISLARVEVRRMCNARLQLQISWLKILRQMEMMEI